MLAKGSVRASSTTTAIMKAIEEINCPATKRNP